MAYVTRHIDWLSFSIQSTEDPRMAFPFLDWHYTGAGLHGFKTRYQCKKTGVVIETDSSNSEMGSHFRMSGDALTELRQEMGAQDDGLANRVIHLHGKASRIDLTINVHEGELTPRDVQKAVKAGRAKAKANVSRFIEGKNGKIEGDTFYIGSPTSDRQFRAYNKAAEMGIVDGKAWLRLELELRRLRADNALHAIASVGADAAISGHMGDFLEWGNLEYQSGLGQESVPPVDIPRRDSNRRRWLLGQVVQALAKEIMLDSDFRDIFNLSVDYSLDLLRPSK